MSATQPHTSLDCVVTGSGPPVVLIHGTGADAESNWGPLIESLSNRYTVVAPNLPGAGKTPAPTDRLELDQLAFAVIDTVQDALGAHQGWHLVGHSLGAVVATAVAARQPDQVRSLVLHAGWLTTGPREALMFDLWSRLLAIDSGLLARHLILEAMSPALLQAANVQQLDEMVAGFTSMLDNRITAQIDLDGRIDLASAVTGIQAVTLVLASADDRIIPPPHQQALAAAIPNARYRELAGGHGLPFEDPARFFLAITEWIDEQQAQREAA
ncbi:MAG: alpha/beta fold hydrolase [Actinomycetota bacterium]|nr:alpha/beta fold hydrolase [Actinomycetota bacterium]